MSNVARYLYAGRTRNQLLGDMALEDGLFGALTDATPARTASSWACSPSAWSRSTGHPEEQDEIALRSHQNALAAWSEGHFSEYVVPIEVPRRKPR